MLKLINLIILIAVAVIGLVIYRFTSGPKVKGIIGCEGCNVVVVLVDTLRADHLPSYGYKRDTAPFLTSLMSKSVVFERAFSASSWTAPATASVFTSMLPSEHGVITGFLATKRMIKDGMPIKMNQLPKEVETLGEFMSSVGYQTIAVADNLNIGPEIGFDRGFKYFRKHKERGAVRMNKTADEFIEKAQKDGPYFLYMHYIDPHAPYEKHSPWFEQCLEEEGDNLKGQTICAYDSEIRFFDQEFEKIFKKYSWDKNTVIFFISDHGEEFWEHGIRGHGRTLYTEVLHVPFTIYHPKWEPRRVKENVHTMDILPTLGAMLGVSHKPQWKGDNLYSHLQNNSFPSDRNIYGERLRTPYSKSKWWRRSIINKDWHFIRSSEPEKVIGEELFDLVTDFYEQNNVFSEHPEVSADLGNQLDLLKPAEEVQGTNTVTIPTDPELIKRLKSLGYLK